jgi:hypothetical protein
MTAKTVKKSAMKIGKRIFKMLFYIELNVCDTDDLEKVAYYLYLFS